ncbi:MAG: hypothetical protein Q7Q73_19230 [Verrucomicrobiota bacterium JB024]|nr:hypothetical protein [Verrucomicrobiota bacterium JB024]
MRFFKICLFALLLPMAMASVGSASSTDSLPGVMQTLARNHQLSGPPLLALPLRQAWSVPPEAGFEPGLVRLYATAEGFVVLAALKDTAIHNAADGFNQKTWETGDVFECFIQTGLERYYELHVTPENQNLFLRWSPATYRAFRAGEIPFATALIDEQSFAQSETSIDSPVGYWTVTLLIPYTSLGLASRCSGFSDTVEYSGEGKPGPSPLRFSFARYDIRPDSDEPVLSATPDFPEANYHLREYWHPVAWPPQQSGMIEAD